MSIRSKLNFSLLDEQIEKLDDAVKTISIVTGRDLSQVEDAVIHLINPPLPPDTCPYCKGTGKGRWTNGREFLAVTNCLFCRGTGSNLR